MRWMEFRSRVAYEFYAYRGGWGELGDEATFNKICDVIINELSQKGPEVLDASNLYTGVPDQSSAEARLIADIIVVVLATLSPHLIPATPVIRAALAKVIDILIMVARERQDSLNMTGVQFWPVVTSWAQEASRL